MQRILTQRCVEDRNNVEKELVRLNGGKIPRDIAISRAHPRDLVEIMSKDGPVLIISGAVFDGGEASAYDCEYLRLVNPDVIILIYTYTPAYAPSNADGFISKDEADSHRKVAQILMTREVGLQSIETLQAAFPDSVSRSPIR